MGMDILPAGEAVEGLPGHLVGEGEGKVHRGGEETFSEDPYDARSPYFPHDAETRRIPHDAESPVMTLIMKIGTQQDRRVQ